MGPTRARDRGNAPNRLYTVTPEKPRKNPFLEPRNPRPGTGPGPRFSGPGRKNPEFLENPRLKAWKKKKKFVPTGRVIKYPRFF